MSITHRGIETDRSGELIFPWRADHSELPECKFHGVFYTEQAAQHAVDTHQCPEPFTGWGYKFMGGAERLWVELDRVVDEIKSMDPASGYIMSTDGTDSVKLFRLQGRATGLAFALVGICTPYYADEKAVSKESLARYKMRNGKMDYRPTPGFKYDPPIPGTPRYKTEHLGSPDGVTTATYTQEHNKGSAPVPAPTSGRRRRAAAPPPKQLTEMEKATIRKAGSGFPLKDLAAMYGVPESAITEVLNDTA